MRSSYEFWLFLTLMWCKLSDCQSIHVFRNFNDRDCLESIPFGCFKKYVIFLPTVSAPRDAFTATSYKPDAQGTAEAYVIVGSIYKFPTEVLDQLDSYDPTTGSLLEIQNYLYFVTKMYKVLFNALNHHLHVPLWIDDCVKG